MLSGLSITNSTDILASLPKSGGKRRPSGPVIRGEIIWSDGGCVWRWRIRLLRFDPRNRALPPLAHPRIDPVVAESTDDVSAHPVCHDLGVVAHESIERNV